MALSHLVLSAGPLGVCGTTEKFQHPVFCSGQLVRVMNIASALHLSGQGVPQSSNGRLGKHAVWSNVSQLVLTLALPAVCVTTER